MKNHSTFLVLLALLPLLQACEPDVAFTTVGTFQGFMDEDTDTAVFLRVPYGKAPIGERRWQAPIPADGNDIPEVPEKLKDYFARLRPPLCFQGIETGLEVLHGESEDCLFLTVWKPNASTKSQRPVMVYIPGGGLEVGGISQTDYDGQILAETTGNLVVSIQYRLGSLGFMAHPALQQESEHGLSGNYGLMDQQLALKWIKNYIWSFGGDPLNITVFGNSAGANSICSHLASPLAEGLFERAIISSGTCSQSVGQTLEAAHAQGELYADLWGCADAADILHCLRGQPPGVLRDILRDAGKSGSVLDLGAAVEFATRITADGYVFDSIDLAAGLQSHNIDVTVIVGVSQDEGTSLQSNVTANNPANETEYSEFFEAYLNFGLPETEVADTLEKVLIEYPLASYDTPADGFADWIGDLIFTCPSRSTAEVLAANGRNVFFYEFAITPKGYNLDFMVGPRHENAPAIGVFHGADLAYLFGHDTIATGILPAENIAFSNTIMKYWGNFAATGTPNAEGLPHWRVFNADSKIYLRIDDDGYHSMTEFKGNKCDLVFAL